MEGDNFWNTVKSYNAETSSGSVTSVPTARQNPVQDNDDDLYIISDTEMSNFGVGRGEVETAIEKPQIRSDSQLRKLLSKQTTVAQDAGSSPILKQQLGNAAPPSSSFADPVCPPLNQLGDNYMNKFDQDPVDIDVLFVSEHPPSTSLNTDALVPKKKSTASPCLKELLSIKGSSEIPQKDASETSAGSRFPLLLKSLKVKNNDIDLLSSAGQSNYGIEISVHTLSRETNLSLRDSDMTRSNMQSLPGLGMEKCFQNSSYGTGDIEVTGDSVQSTSDIVDMEASPVDVSYGLRKRDGIHRVVYESFEEELSDRSDREDSDHFYYDIDDLDDDYNPGVEGSDSEGEHQYNAVHRRTLKTKRESGQLSESPPKKKSRGKQAISVLEQLTGQTGEENVFQEGYSFRKRSEKSTADVLQLVSQSDTDSSDNSRSRNIFKKRREESSDSGEEYEPEKQHRFQKRNSGNKTRRRSSKLGVGPRTAITSTNQSPPPGSMDKIGPACSTLLQLASNVESPHASKKQMPGAIDHSPTPDSVSRNETYKILKLLLETPSNVDMPELQASIDNLSTIAGSCCSPQGERLSEKCNKNSVLPESNRLSEADDSTSSRISLLKRALSARAEQQKDAGGEKEAIVHEDTRVERDTDRLLQSYSEKLGNDPAQSECDNSLATQIRPIDPVFVKTEPKSLDHCSTADYDSYCIGAKPQSPKLFGNFGLDYVRLKTEPGCQEFPSVDSQSMEMYPHNTTDSLGLKSVPEYGRHHHGNRGNEQSDSSGLNTSLINTKTIRLGPKFTQMTEPSGVNAYHVKTELPGPNLWQSYSGKDQNNESVSQYNITSATQTWYANPVVIKSEPESPEHCTNVDHFCMEAKHGSLKSMLRIDPFYAKTEHESNENPAQEKFVPWTTGRVGVQSERGVLRYEDTANRNREFGTNGSKTIPEKPYVVAPGPNIGHLGIATSGPDCHYSEQFVNVKTEPLDYGFNSSTDFASTRSDRLAMRESLGLNDGAVTQSVGPSSDPFPSHSQRPVSGPFPNHSTRPSLGPFPNHSKLIDSTVEVGFKDPVGASHDASFHESFIRSNPVHPTNVQTNFCDKLYSSGRYGMDFVRRDVGSAQSNLDSDFSPINYVPKIQKVFTLVSLPSERFITEELQGASVKLHDKFSKVDTVNDNSAVIMPQSATATKPNRSVGSVGDMGRLKVPHSVDAQLLVDWGSTRPALQIATGQSAIDRGSAVSALQIAAAQSFVDQSSAASALQTAVAQSACDRGSAGSALQTAAAQSAIDRGSAGSALQIAAAQSAIERGSAGSALQIAAAQSAIDQGSAMFALQLLAKFNQFPKTGDGKPPPCSTDRTSTLQQSSPTLTALLTDRFNLSKKF